MSSVTSNANVNSVKIRHTNPAVDVSTFSSYSLYCQNLYSGGSFSVIDLNGIVGINVDPSLTGAANNLTTIAGAPALAQTVYIGGNDASTYGANTGAKTVNIGNSLAANAVNICNSANTSDQTVDIASNTGVGTGARTVTILGGVPSSGTHILNLASGAYAKTVNVASGNGAKTVAIADGISGNTISVGNGANTSAQTVEIACGASAANSTVSIFNGTLTAGTRTLNLAAGASAHGINVGTGSGVINTIVIGGTGANTVSICNTQTGGSLSLCTAMTSGTLTIGNQTSAAGEGATVGVALKNHRVPVLTNAAALELHPSDSGKIILLNTADNDVTFSGTFAAGMIYEFFQTNATPGTVTITVATNALSGGIVVIDNDTANTTNAYVAAGNKSIITFTNTNGLQGSWVKLVYTAAAAIAVTGVFQATTNANPFS